MRRTIERAPPPIPKPRHVTRHVPFTWPEIALVSLCLAAVFGCLWLMLDTLEAQRRVWADPPGRHESCEFLGQCGPVTDDHYRRDGNGRS